MLEPGCGSGNFIAFAPASRPGDRDRAGPGDRGDRGLLYPDAEIRTESFADSRDGDGSFDLAIGNVPFGNMTLHDRRHNPAGHSIHNHFIIKALHLVRPGGVVAVLTSRFTMDARNPAARREIASLADLAGAIRLPGGAHQRAAGTTVVTDLLVLRRREPGRPPDGTAWEKTQPVELDGAQVPVNEYFLDPPDAVLGEMGATNGAYRADDLVVRPAGDTTAALVRCPGRTGQPRPGPAAWPGPPHRDQARPAETGPRSRQPDGYLEARRDGTFTQVAQGHGSRSRYRPARQPSCGTCSRLRDAVTGLLDAEAASAEDTPELDALRRDLDRRYDDYVRAYGTLNRFSWRRTGRPDPDTGGGETGPHPPAAGRLPRRPVRAPGPGAGGIRPGRPDRRQGRHLHQPRHRPPQPPAGR